MSAPRILAGLLLTVVLAAAEAPPDPARQVAELQRTCERCFADGRHAEAEVACRSPYTPQSVVRGPWSAVVKPKHRRHLRDIEMPRNP